MLIDTHAHLEDKQFDVDREEVVKRAFASGLEKIINIGAGLRSSEKSIALAQKHENIFAVVGCHPEYFMCHGSWNEAHQEKLAQLAGAEKVVAIGEIGLEYHCHCEKDVTEDQKVFQKEGFVYQLGLAKKLNLPVVIHCRGARAEAGLKYREEGRAYEDVLEIIEKFPELKFVFHSFGGRLDFAQKIMNSENIFFSFNGNITYAKPNAEILEVVKVVPLEKIMLETDCPYLAPVPNRGKRNEPSFVRDVAKKIAEIKNTSSAKVEEVTTQNAKSFFNL